MKKIISIIPVAILFFVLLSSEKVFAISYDAEVNNSRNAIIVGIPSGQEASYYHYYLITSNYPLSINGNYIQGTQFGYYCFYQFPQSNGSNGSSGSNSSLRVTSPVVIVKGSLGGVNSTTLNVYNSVNDYNNGNLANPSPTPSPTPIPASKKWYKEMWEETKDYLTGDQDIVSWFTGIIDSLFGDDEEQNTIVDSVAIGAPSLAPTPTPIPYQTVVVPTVDQTTGVTIYETKYYYTDNSGNNIVASAPPTQTPSNNSNGGGSNEYSPIGGQPYDIPELSWLTSGSVSDGTTSYDGIDSINGGMDSINEIGSEYEDGMSMVQNATGTLPVSWLLLIGVAAAIPLLAGIISRFLS